MTFIGVSRHKNKIVFFFFFIILSERKWVAIKVGWVTCHEGETTADFFGQLNSLSSQKTEQFCVFCDMEETNERQVETFQNKMRKIEPQSLRIIVVSQL